MWFIVIALAGLQFLLLQTFNRVDRVRFSNWCSGVWSKSVRSLVRVQYDTHRVSKCIEVLRNWCNEHATHTDHGFHHFMEVFQHALKAVSERVVRVQCTPFEVTAILLAALLHDVDDRKVVKPHTKTSYSNARTLLMSCDCEDYVALVLEMISLVSTSTNGNANTLPLSEKWKYIPRDCDRLEALGDRGIKRLGTGGFRSGLAFRVSNTPLPTSREEIRKVVAQRPLENYVHSGGNSASVLDHFYDKLFHLHVVASQNPYLVRENGRLMNFTMGWILRTNYVLRLVDRYDDEKRKPGDRIEDSAFDEFLNVDTIEDL
jgi:HD superfamily phosphodiesterase